MKTLNPFIHNPPLEFRCLVELSADERNAEMEALKDALTYHNYLRSILHEPEISESAYLLLRRRLSELEAGR